MGGPPRVMALDGTRLDVGQAQNVLGLDVSDPALPTFLGPSPLLPADVAARDGHVFVAMASAGLQAVDTVERLFPMLGRRWSINDDRTGRAGAGDRCLRHPVQRVTLKLNADV